MDAFSSDPSNPREAADARRPAVAQRCALPRRGRRGTGYGRKHIIDKKSAGRRNTARAAPAPRPRATHATRIGSTRRARGHFPNTHQNSKSRWQIPRPIPRADGPHEADRAQVDRRQGAAQAARDQGRAQERAAEGGVKPTVTAPAPSRCARSASTRGWSTRGSSCASCPSSASCARSRRTQDGPAVPVYASERSRRAEIRLVGLFEDLPAAIHARHDHQRDTARAPIRDSDELLSCFHTADLAHRRLAVCPSRRRARRRLRAPGLPEHFGKSARTSARDARAPGAAHDDGRRPVEELVR